MHPDLLAQEQARQDKAREQFAVRSRRRVRVAVTSLVVSLLALVTFAGLHVAAGLTWFLVAASAVAVAASADGVVRAGRRQRSGAAGAIPPGLALRDEQVVRLRELDGSCGELAARGRKAIAAMIPDGNARPSLLDEAALRQDEWDLALFLRMITRVRARYGADPDAQPDAAARKALAAAEDRAAAWVRDLEENAAQFKATSTAIRRYQEVDKATRLRNDGLDLSAALEAVVEPGIARANEFNRSLRELKEHFEDKMGENPHSP